MQTHVYYIKIRVSPITTHMLYRTKHGLCPVLELLIYLTSDSTTFHGLLLCLIRQAKGCYASSASLLSAKAMRGRMRLCVEAVSRCGLGDTKIRGCREGAKPPTNLGVPLQAHCFLRVLFVVAPGHHFCLPRPILFWPVSILFSSPGPSIFSGPDFAAIS